MILKKSGWDADGGSSSATMLGLKIVGGKRLQNGQRGAIIERVKKGSVAELEGGLRPGNWNKLSTLRIVVIRKDYYFRKCISASSEVGGHHISRMLVLYGWLYTIYEYIDTSS